MYAVNLPPARIAHRDRPRTSRDGSICFTDGGPFVYRIGVINASVRVRVWYIEDLINSRSYTAEVGLEPIGNARLVSYKTHTAVEAYLIARFVYNLIADGRVEWHKPDVTFVEFPESDIGTLPGLPSPEMKLSVRALPARGPSPLYRVAAWTMRDPEASAVLVLRDDLYASFHAAIEAESSESSEGAPVDSEASIAVFGAASRSGARCRGAIGVYTDPLTSTETYTVMGELFTEPFISVRGTTQPMLRFLTHADDTRAVASGGGLLRAHVLMGVSARATALAVSRALRRCNAQWEKRALVYPAIDELLVYSSVAHPWLTGGEFPAVPSGESRILIDLENNAYVFGIEGRTPTMTWYGVSEFLASMDPSAPERLSRAQQAVAEVDPEGASAALAEREAERDAERELEGAKFRSFVSDRLDMLRRHNATVAPPASAWNARGLFAAELPSALAAMSGVSGNCGMVVQVSTPKHALCGVLLAQRNQDGSSDLRLLVRNSHTSRIAQAHLDHLGATIWNHGPTRARAVEVEVVDARGAYTQADEGSCALQAVMYVVYMLDVGEHQIRHGSVDAVRALLRRRPLPIYALIALRIGSFYGGEFRERGEQNTILVQTVPITVVSASDMDHPLLSVQRSTLVDGRPSTARVVARIAPDGGVVLLESTLTPAPAPREVAECASVAARAVLAAYGVQPGPCTLTTGVLYGTVAYVSSKRMRPAFGAMLYTDV
jgi:hypothetical protein